MASSAIQMLSLSACLKQNSKMTILDLACMPADATDHSDTETDAARRRDCMSEGDDDVDRAGQVKNRRKQARPVRIASTESESIAGENTDQPNQNTPVATTAAERFPFFPIDLSANNTTASENAFLDNYLKAQQASCADSLMFGGLYQPATSTPSKSVTAVPTPPPHSVSPIRIFNPEAFCDLCNKEFCNKYFLKTHKANKHGIYADVSQAAFDSLPLPLPLPSLPFSSITNTVHLNSGGQTVPVACARVPSKRDKSPFLSVGPSANSAVAKSLTSTNGSKAFCDVCRREFCNKYFVRRHKAKIHGIVDCSENGDSVEQRNQLVNGIKSSNTDNEKSEDADSHKPWALPRPSSNSSSSLHQPDKENKDLASHTMFLEKSRQQSCFSFVIEKETDSDRNQTPEGVPVAINSTNFQSWFNGNVNVNGMKKDSDGMSEKSKKSGSINVEAFCDICCKEYCNKYFLRTHKMKSHGIMPADFEKKEERFTVNENVIDRSSPLNLIVGDQKNERRETIQSDLESREIFCNVCNTPFKSLSSLNTHISQFHSPELKRQTENGSFVKEDHNNKTHIINSQVETSLQPVINKNFNRDEKNVRLNDFQKMHSMMLKMNSNCNEAGLCELCNKDFGQSPYLELHLVEEHASLLEEMTVAAEEDNSNSQTLFMGGKFNCNYCQMSFPSSQSLNEHVFESHPNPTQQLINHNDSPINKDNEETSKAERVASSLFSLGESQTTPTSSFCEICRKELCNKYFMKTHMQRMHGISIENGAQIGGVVCDICNKELCSKYFLRVHKQNSHGIVEEAVGLDLSRNRSPDTEDRSLLPMEHADPACDRYWRHFDEVCPVCSRRFRSAKWLRAHLLSEHAEESKESKPESLAEAVLRVRRSLERVADAGDVPACYSVPRSRTASKSPIMQPFVLGPDSGADPFLSSVVYLPVSEKLSFPVTASFKLTPT
ncbi:PR domain zinc finger protein 15 [Nilaparvata lugens]|uniref:PR domain zinc finger protein 15 n=1 Tax=Nilaparvata lugens TaxID=108931 RepID=UPI00193E76AD|nr:PR domain zinc finger protein 15 [Nilaparvata lugens]XP_039298361.1 PR domain zinc finger protein 15 [Nilaparvata lugens]